MTGIYQLNRVVAFFLLLLAGCSGAPNSEQRAEYFANERFGGEFEIVPGGGEFVLCVKKEKPKPGVQPLAFFVYSTTADSIVYERELESGTVKWLEEGKLSIVRIPGNISGDETADAFTEIYDLSTRTSSK
ncbi:MAG: hypothetical protein KF749_07400 [Bacteroidetes bacterium]|nr:hypothetical protein [Bacteroidota bacterium]MCW5896597.1 hypothetical protein [Bacteroidota bacterium]